MPRPFTSPRRLIALAVLGAATACGGETASPKDEPDASTPGPPGIQDGTRIVARRNPQKGTELWDVERDVECVPHLALDGSVRCLPPEGGLFYSDAGCTAQIAAVSELSCADRPSYVSHAGGPSCPAPALSVYRLGAETSAPSSVYQEQGGFCGSRLGGTGATEHFYEALPMDPSEWVEFQEAVEPRTSRLAVATWVGSDGSRVPNGLRLIDSGSACDEYDGILEPENAHRCVPLVRASYQGGIFADAACTSPVVHSCDATELSELRAGEPSPTGAAGFFETGEEISDAYMTSFVDGSCGTVPTGWLDANHRYRVGPSTTLARYPELSTVIEGDERIRKEYVSSEGKKLLFRSLYDSRYEEACEPTELADGSTRCVPASVPWVSGTGLFGDAECTLPVAITTGAGPKWLLKSSVTECGLSAPAAYVAVPHDGPVYQGFQPGQCQPFPYALGQQRAYELADPIDAAELFAEIEPEK